MSLPTWTGRGSLALLLAGCGAAGGQPASGQPPAAASSQPPAVVAAPTPLRRLTNEEYNNTIRDLLGDTSRPASAFPPDEVVGGFENNTVSPVTQSLVERYMGAAEAVAAAATRHLDRLAPCAPGAPREPCGRAFIESFGRLAFRRPLDDGERATLLALYNDKERRSDHARAVQLVLEAMLQSPRFLYRPELADERGRRTRALTGHEVATRLSFWMWASTPDAALLDDAAAGRLATAEGVGQAARRLLGDPRAVDGIRSFHRQWLDLRELETTSRDPATYPAFTPGLRAAMLEETLRFGAHTALAGGDAVAALLTSRQTSVNEPLARLYGVAPPAAGAWALVDLPASQRAGVLTQASVLTVHDGGESTSPIFRGKFVREKLLCEPIPPPPANAVIALPRVDPGVTSREQLAMHRLDPSCAACHEKMDPVGFGFEHYDALGAWRSLAGASPVDATGQLAGTDTDGPFDGAVALGARLSTSRQVRRCVATVWFRAAIGRAERDEDTASLDRIHRAFARAGFDVRELLVAIATSDSFRHAGLETGSTP